MKSPLLIQSVDTPLSPEDLARHLHDQPGVVLLRSAMADPGQGRYSLVAVRPFLVFRAWASRCEIHGRQHAVVQYGNPWQILDTLMSRYELLDEIDFPFPLGGCFGYWGYDLKHFVEPRLPRQAFNDLELPDCHVGFYRSLVVFDHQLGRTWVVAVGLREDGSRDANLAHREVEHWMERIAMADESETVPAPRLPKQGPMEPFLESNMSRNDYVRRVEQAQALIRQGHIYQVNLAQRWKARLPGRPWEFFQDWLAVSPAPYAAWLNCGEFQLASSSPELFLRLSGAHAVTRPIKGTRPRSADVDQDARLSYELQTSGKEMAELVMITDLLRNDLGRVCEFGSVNVPELVRLERYAQVQHLVSTVEGQLRADQTHLSALAQCFPGGSITGAPKIRAMEIIDALEPVTRGPYTGCLGYLGFNRESQLSILIRMAVCRGHHAYYHAGAGIVADSNAEAEYEETLSKAAGFKAVLTRHSQPAAAGMNQPRRGNLTNPEDLDRLP